MKVTINAGHCPGMDNGAVGQTGLQEAYVARDISLSICKYLNAVGYETQFVQANELYEITELSNSFGSDLFVSIHCNSAVNQDAQGTETFAYLDGYKGYKLADCIQNEIVNSMGTVDRGVKTNGFYVLKHTNCPAVLVECEFISNSEGECILASSEGQDGFARAIARGVTDYVATIQ